MWHATVFLCSHLGRICAWYLDEYNINVSVNIFQGRNRQRTLEAQLAELTSVQPGEISGQDSSSPEGSSDVDEVCMRCK
jgi:hypothetical protein